MVTSRDGHFFLIDETGLSRSASHPHLRQQDPHDEYRKANRCGDPGGARIRADEVISDQADPAELEHRRERPVLVQKHNAGSAADAYAMLGTPATRSATPHATLAL
jgi:hypothetical protein